MDARPPGPVGEGCGTRLAAPGELVIARRRSRRPLSRARPRRRGARRLTPALVAFGLAGLGLVGLERAGRLPESVAEVVRTAEAELLAPLLAELGLEWPGTPGARRVALPASADDRAAVAQAAALLEDVPVEPERRRGYDRAAWPHWTDADGDCLDARHEVLASESLGRARLSRDGCSVVAGLWRDPFTGETVTDPGALDVDHLVPLQEAHDSGGWAWDRERRAAFANDLGDPRSLAAVRSEANRAKSAQGPEDWLPPDPSHRCQRRLKTDPTLGSDGEVKLTHPWGRRGGGVPHPRDAVVLIP